MFKWHMTNAFYGFEEDGELQVLDESSNRSDEDDSNNDGNLEELEMDDEQIEPEENVIILPSFYEITYITHSWIGAHATS